MTKEEKRLYDQEYVKKYPEKIRAKSLKWRTLNYTYALNQKKAWYRKNRELLLKRAKQYRKDNPQKTREAVTSWRKRFMTSKKARGYTLKREYGLTQEQVEKIKTQQNNMCALCVKRAPICVDHCHTTKRIRGMLCRSCNTALGVLGDNEDGLKKALNYVRNP